jgi:hypothetical protein
MRLLRFADRGHGQACMLTLDDNRDNQCRHIHICCDVQIDPGLGAGLGTPAAARLMPGGGGGCDGLPAVNRAYNLYQPYDPIAYRCMPRLSHVSFDTLFAHSSWQCQATYAVGGARLDASAE